MLIMGDFTRTMEILNKSVQQTLYDTQYVEITFNVVVLSSISFKDTLHAPLAM